MTVAIPAAYAFSRYRFFGSRMLFFGFLVFRMMAPAILLVPFVQIFSEIDLIDTYIAVAHRALLLQRADRGVDTRRVHFGHPARDG